MTKTNGEYKGHCLTVPYPIQGHINPMLQFAKRLSHKHLKITFALTKFLFKTTTHLSGGESISIRVISDGFDNGGRAQAKSFEEYQIRFMQTGQQTLSELLHDLAISGCNVDCVVYDPFIPWVLDVAKGFGLNTAVFFKQSCAVDNIYYQVYSGELKPPVLGSEPVVVPGLPPMRPEEMPSFIYVHGSYPAAFKMVADQFRNVDKADWIFVNTFLQVGRGGTASEEAMLPNNFSNETLEKGLIVSWSSQLEVLAHEAIGCFITHCGWNSTLEGLSLGVPMVAMPQWTDQSTNAKFVEEVWGVGIRAIVDDKGLVTKEEIVRCIKHVMDSDDGKKIRVNGIKWKEMAREVVDEGRSSDRNIEEFVSILDKSFQKTN
ncbi:hypothetical protein BUALT_Bualt12G0049400 [Buddleja alternifolia]|uniref:Glycosyltransferase n=1 Tax=Buddleja alternifolia TaxID=168488 RepID=A0AAV6WTK4_9LAMI|nr:hypothetical protein BUALT_Bualt12G0049400 [Buddleja alternifolia]